MNRDEIHRQLRAADRAQRAALGPWRDAVARIFSESQGTPAERARVVGVPDRRRFLRVGGSAVLGAAVLAACGEKVERPPSETGITAPLPASTTLAPPASTSPEDGKKNDIAVLRTSVSLELVAVDVYETILGQSSTKLPEDINFDTVVTDLAKLFGDHHRAHATKLRGLVREAGGNPVEEANKAVVDGIVMPTLPDLTNQQAVVRFARDVENAAASTYGWAAGVFSTTELRQEIMAVGGVEARHAAALALALDPSGRDAVPETFLDTSGPARIPEEAILEDDQDGDDLKPPPEG